MSRAEAVEIARNALPADCVEFRLHKPVTEDDVTTWSGDFETVDGAEGEFAFEDHYPDGFMIEWL